MSILFGHPTGNPNSHHAALAHYERGRLAAFVVPWMPSPAALQLLESIPPLRSNARRLGRRRFGPLADAPKIQGRLGEFGRLLRRATGYSDEGLAYEANDWLMASMRAACRRKDVTAVHAYEDASLWSFQEAKNRSQACIYDLPIGYYPAWEGMQRLLIERYRDWLPSGGLPSSKFVRPEQKRREMELADVVLVPSEFVRATVLQHVQKRVALAPYGIDSEYWQPGAVKHDGPLVFLYAGQASVRKGTPFLLKAWRLAAISDAQLRIVGSWQLAEDKRHNLPPRCQHVGPMPQDDLRLEYQRADVFVLPTFFEGRALVGGEAMACGLPLLTTPASGLTDMVNDANGRSIECGNLDALVETLRWFAHNRDLLSGMRSAARLAAERYSWVRYRQHVADAVAAFA